MKLFKYFILYDTRIPPFGKRYYKAYLSICFDMYESDVAAIITMFNNIPVYMSVSDQG